MVSTPKLPLLVCWFVCIKKVEIVDNFLPIFNAPSSTIFGESKGCLHWSLSEYFTYKKLFSIRGWLINTIKWTAAIALTWCKVEKFTDFFGTKGVVPSSHQSKCSLVGGKSFHTRRTPQIRGCYVLHVAFGSTWVVNFCSWVRFLSTKMRKHEAFGNGNCKSNTVPPKVREIFPTEETLQIFGWVLMGPLGTCFKSMIEPLQI